MSWAFPCSPKAPRHLLVILPNKRGRQNHVLSAFALLAVHRPNSVSFTSGRFMHGASLTLDFLKRAVDRG